MSKFKDKKSPIRCIIPDCKDKEGLLNTLSEESLKIICLQSTDALKRSLNKWHDDLQAEKATWADPNYRYCPHCWNNTPDSPGQITAGWGRATCTKCAKDFCADACHLHTNLKRGVAHEGHVTCAEYEAAQPASQKEIDEIKKLPNMVECPMCSYVQQKGDGCNEVKCGQDNGHANPIRRNDRDEWRGCGRKFCCECILPWAEADRRALMNGRIHTYFKCENPKPNKSADNAAPVQPTTAIPSDPVRRNHRSVDTRFRPVGGRNQHRAGRRRDPFVRPIPRHVPMRHDGGIDLQARVARDAERVGELLRQLERVARDRRQARRRVP